MEEKILQTKKNGMAVLLLTLAGYVAAIAAFVLAVFQMERDNYILGVPLLIVAFRVSVPAPPSSTSKDSRVSFADASLA